LDHAVHWLDWVPAADLPALVAGHDVCLGIFGTGDKALRVVPNKVFQGAAVGCAVVTSDTAPQRQALGDAAVLVPPRSPEALVTALLRLADDRAELVRMRRQAHDLAREQFAPERIVAPLARRLVPADEAIATPQRHDEEHGMISPTRAARPAADVNAVAPLAPNSWLRYDVVRRMLPADGVTDVLEIGCGQGAFGARLAQRFHYLGVEPDAASWNVASRRIGAIGRGEVRNVAVEALGEERFDLVCAFEVLEHIEDDAAALKEWAARLRPSGWLMLSVPAHQRRYGPWDELVGHFRRCDPEAITTLLGDTGFAEIEIRQYGFPLGFVLEAARDVIGRRRLAGAANQSLAERTAGSGRQLQPSAGLKTVAIRWGTAPFRMAQRAFPHTGTGLVVLARLADRD
jgi:SAM-dependent methyltransferase